MKKKEKKFNTAIIHRRNKLEWELFIAKNIHNKFQSFNFQLFLQVQIKAIKLLKWIWRHHASQNLPRTRFHFRSAHNSKNLISRKGGKICRIYRSAGFIHKVSWERNSSQDHVTYLTNGTFLFQFPVLLRRCLWKELMVQSFTNGDS